MLRGKLSSPSLCQDGHKVWARLEFLFCPFQTARGPLKHGIKHNRNPVQVSSTNIPQNRSTLDAHRLRSQALNFQGSWDCFFLCVFSSLFALLTLKMLDCILEPDSALMETEQRKGQAISTSECARRSALTHDHLAVYKCLIFLFIDLHGLFFGLTLDFHFPSRFSFTSDILL